MNLPGEPASSGTDAFRRASDVGLHSCGLHRHRTSVGQHRLQRAGLAGTIQSRARTVALDQVDLGSLLQLLHLLAASQIFCQNLPICARASIGCANVKAQTEISSNTFCAASSSTFSVDILSYTRGGFFA